MEREELQKQTKSKLIDLIFQLNKEKHLLEKENNDLRNVATRNRLEEYLYEDYISTKKELEDERNSNILNHRRIDELEELLRKYKCIVDRLGGKGE